jgi:hypothetical protein
MKYGHLRLIRPARSGGSGVGAIWTAQCDCGVEREVIARRVVAGQIKSCGKCQFSLGIRSSGKSARARNIDLGKALRTIYLREMRRAGRDWHLSLEQLADIVASNCTYCGLQSGRSRSSGKMLYNRLVKVDSSLGCTPANMKPCCIPCREMRGSLSHQEFLDKCTIIYLTSMSNLDDLT